MNKKTNKVGAYHIPVLRKEAIQALQIDPSGIYVDATFGGGGHAREILKKIDRGRLIGFDQDRDAIKNKPEDERLILIRENFRYIRKFLRVEKAVPVSGILADLGVSSYQFDTAERGFSIHKDALLDMRMDRRQQKTAADILRKYTEDQLWHLLEDYGEVRNAKTLAAHLIKERQRFPLETVGELKNIITPVIKGNERRYLAQVFQALRMEVNDEMAALKELLEQAVTVLKPGGRLVIITFHSIEDRVVKQFIKKEEQNHQASFETNENGWLKSVVKKPIVPTRDEIKQNSRAASAKMRVAEKMKEQ